MKLSKMKWKHLEKKNLGDPPKKNPKNHNNPLPKKKIIYKK